MDLRNDYADKVVVSWENGLLLGDELRDYAIDLLRHIGTKNKVTAVAVASGYDERLVREKAIILGINDYMGSVWGGFKLPNELFDYFLPKPLDGEGPETLYISSDLSEIQKAASIDNPRMVPVLLGADGHPDYQSAADLREVIPYIR